MLRAMRVVCLLVVVAGPAGVSGGTKKMTIDTRASPIDVAARRYELQHAKSARVLAALAQLE